MSIARLDAGTTATTMHLHKEAGSPRSAPVAGAPMQLRALPRHRLAPQPGRQPSQQASLV